MTSSQGRRELQIAKLGHGEIESRTRLIFALCKKQMSWNSLKENVGANGLENIVEHNKKKLNEKKIVKTELRDDEVEIELDMNKSVVPSSITHTIYPQE